MVSVAHQSVAGSPLLETKLYAPRRRPGQVSRPRLVERLARGSEGKLTLVSAPAGFGKSTLLAEWLAARPAGGRPAAWVSLDESDNDPARIWAYVVTALRRVAPEVGEGALASLRSPQPPPVESILATVINELAALDEDVLLVLDDLHVIESQPIHGAIAFLLDHLPPRMHLVAASRADPPLPLTRLRARGDLIELRAADLRFTPDEAAAFFDEVMGLRLSAGDVAALETRTEGWIAGLQLAALSMRGRADVSGFITTFAGDDRYILDFLVEEVLQRQPEPVRTFLLRTSILDRLSGPLCDAVTGQDDGAGMLGALERGNLFVVPLDDKRTWYRYHHLFADVLQTRAVEEQPDQVSVRHRRASAWFEGNGLRWDAIRHALAAGDAERAADLVELAALPMLGSGQEDTLWGWLTALPDEVVRARPVLSVYRAYATFSRGSLEEAETRLRDAERWLDTTGDPGARGDAPAPAMAVADEAAFASLPGTIAIARAYAAGSVGDMPGIVTHARRALDLLPEADNLWCGAAAALLGIAYWTLGDLEAAYLSFTDGRARLKLAGHVRFQIVGTHILADIRIAQGRLNDAERTYRQALRLATEQGEPIWGTADLHVGLSQLHRERNDLDAATRHLLSSKGLGDHAGLADTRHRWYVAMARIHEAHGDLDGALTLLDEAERQYFQGPDPDVHPIAALRARMWIQQGRLIEAQRWARERNVSVDDDLTYLHEFEHITLARLLVARSTRERVDRVFREAVGLLGRLLSAAEAGDRGGSVIEILVVQARARAGWGDTPAALVALERALTLAEPEGYARLFLGEGEAMRDLFRQAAARGIAPAYTRRLLSAFDTSAQPTSPPTQVPAPSLAEPLTAREVEVLRLIAAGMRNAAIGNQLFIGLSTVKRHIANAYGKLGATNRVEAVARANELNLL